MTSPTGIRAIARLDGPDVAAKVWDTIEAKRGARIREFSSHGCAHGTLACHACSASDPSCQFEAREQPVARDEVVRAATPEFYIKIGRKTHDDGRIATVPACSRCRARRLDHARRQRAGRGTKLGTQTPYWHRFVLGDAEVPWSPTARCRSARQEAPSSACPTTK